jgi:DNA-binding transcriptional LysR family regulator
MLDLKRLEILQRFASCGSIAATAAYMGYSSSAVSQQLATLEREAGVALIERTAHSANLTDAGRELVEHATAVLAAAELAQSRMRARAGTISGRVTVSCIPGLAVGLAPHLAELQRRHPGLTIVAHQTEPSVAAAAVLDRTADLAVIDDWTQEPIQELAGLTVHRLHREPIVLALKAGHPAASDTGSISVATLRDVVASETWLTAPLGHISRTASDVGLAEVGVQPARRGEFDGLHVRARLVSTGAGIALLPVSVVDEQPGVVGLLLRPRMYRYVHILTRSTTREDPAIATCVDTARRALKPPTRRR